MTQEPWLDLEETMKKRRNRKRWQKIATALCALVVFCTTYALILPAITLEKGCPIPEHTHGPECYTQVTVRQETTLSCAAQVHQHTDSCYDEHHNPVCGYADFLVHVHEECCYDGSGNLRCTLPEIKAHSHDEGCYAPGHSHGADCYTQVQGPLICHKHVHTESCWAETQETVCGQEESPDHTHGEECYRVIREQTCGEDSDHTHGEECYAWEQELTCTQEETPVLVCRKPEIMLHRHTGNCYGENGQLVCGMLQILQHQHGEECFVTQEIPVDRSALTCQDETHEHGPQCYGQWQLVCPLEEHTHDDLCTPGQEPTEEAQETEATEETQETEPTEATEETQETEPTEESRNPETPLPESTPSGLPVLGQAYAAVDPYGIMPLMLEEDEAVLEDRDGSTGPVVVNQYIQEQGTKLEYRETSDGTWKNTQDPDATDIPGNAEFKLTVKYAGVPIQNLLDAGGQLSYTLPEVFRKITAEGVIHSEGTEIGSMTANDRTVTITFDLDWLQTQKKNNDVIGGDFYVQAMVNLTQIPDSGDKTIQIGDVNFTVNFKENLLAQYGDVTITKTVEPKVTQDEDGNDYLEYTITVTAGQDGCPVVKVQDVFGDGKTWVDSYVVTDAEGKKVAINNDNKTMTWTIGNMDPGAKRTLEYKVKLKPGYIGGDSQDKIKNEAQVFSKTFYRKSGAACFEPKAKGTLSKVGSSVKTLEDGSMRITYYIWVKALEENSYPLRDMIIRDALDGTGSLYNATSSEILPFVHYDKTSFQLYEGGNNQQKSTTDLTPCSTQNTPTFENTTLSDGKENGRFIYHVGSLAPGQCRTLSYSVIIDPGAFTAAKNNDFQIHNRAEIFSVKDDNSISRWLNAFNCDKTIDRKAWTRKIAGSPVTEETTIPMTPGTVYDSADGTNPTSFTVPKGSQQYQVLVNEAGDWDVSGATLTDTLESNLMKFVGYVRVDAYKIDTPKPDSGASGTNQPKSNASNTDALNWFNNQQPTETFWVNIDGQRQFSFTPSRFSQEKNRAYRLTYYAKSFSTGSIKVENTFTLSGDVYYLGKRYEKVSISSKAEAIVSEDSSFGATKQALFYEAPTAQDANGYLYWAIRVSGTALPEGFDIQDMPGTENGLKGHSLTANSLVGVYTGPNDLSFTGCTTLSDVMKKQLTRVDATKYTVSQDHSTVTLNEPITLGDQSLYILVKTQPTELPEKERDVFTYQNRFQYSFEDGNWVKGSPASQTIYGKGSIFKELADVFTYDGTDLKILKTTSKTTTQRADYDATLLKNQPGEYVGWLIHLNHAGTLSGKYRVVETVPEGMEIAYIRMYWYGQKLSGYPNSEMTQISDPGSDWKEVTSPSEGNNTGRHTNYYYVKGQTAIMEVSNLVAGGATDQDAADKYAVELQIVCKLVDKDVLQGGKTGTFHNQVKLSTLGGQVLDTDGSPVTLSVSTMSKKKGETTGLSGATYPFVITVNEKGIDLMPGDKNDTITLVDELGEGLTIDAESIQVTNTNSPETAVTWTSSVETAADGKQTLRIVLPDDKPLTITYTVSVNAPPEQTVTVTNNAHWEGYATTGGSKVEDKTFKVQVGGTAGGDTTPKIKILKLDESNTQAKLAGAEFKLTEMKLADGKLVETETVQQGQTGADGTLTFGDGENASPLAYNKVYKIVETKAPDGYVRDETPHYAMVVKDANSINESNYQGIDGITVNFWYATSTYTHRAYNHKGEITLEKKFAKADGTGLDGSLNGTYKFGLYEDAEGQTKVQETKAVFAFGNPTVEAKFKNVDLNKNYYVFELDDKGDPIKPGESATVSGIPFVVNYDQGQKIRVTAAASTGSIAVTNRMNYRELPQTGGVGTGLYRISGAALALLAGCMLTGREKRKRIKTHK